MVKRLVDNGSSPVLNIVGLHDIINIGINFAYFEELLSDRICYNIKPVNTHVKHVLFHTFLNIYNLCKYI